MDDRDSERVSCLLCQRSQETKITGALSTKDEVTAHQNCLLFSSGLYCQSSPEFDDLFGFSVEKVLTEVKRGSKLFCDKCKKKGATVGCEVKRCKKSYHYPCAVSANATIIENTKEEKYVLYCYNHDPQKQEINGFVNGHTSSSKKARTRKKNPIEVGPSKVYCLACEKTEGHICLESLSNSIVMFYCDKHAPASKKGNSSGDSTPAQQTSLYSSDSNSSTSAPRSSSKKRLNSSGKQEGTPSKHKCKSRHVIDSSESDENGPDSEMAPLETDIDESANSMPESQLIR
ncbi:PHD finger protein 11 isoform X1 [Centropristis striata]|uniref:PHD finger protein 11 isoform X1 n=1 Tax=Centropristis striata TaxID=184440 RepID=UPI0027E170E1|nr:PHD finger protein 11 isoform X1 [Centropristis striata]